MTLDLSEGELQVAWNSANWALVCRFMMRLAMVPLLLLISAVPPPTVAPPGASSSVVLLLRDGSRIETLGPIDRKGSRLTFRNRAGVLYSIPASEVEREINVEQTTASSTMLVMSGEPDILAGKPRLAEAIRGKLNDKDNLLRKIEQNHAGTAAPPAAREEPPLPAEAVAAAILRNPDEWAWRREARSHEEALQRAREDLAMLQTREKKLEDEILTLASRGYRARQFTYQTSELVHVREQIEPAKLEVTRAQRALDEFMDDARRQDILPGWLR